MTTIEAWLGFTFGLMVALFAGVAEAGPPQCGGGKLAVEGGCCWPSQRFEGGRCVGLPRCASGMVVSAGECVTKAAYADGLAIVCAQLDVENDVAPPSEEKARRACEELAGMLGDAEAGLTRACDAGNAGACVLLGGARQGYRTVSARVDLWVARCKGNNCDGHRRTAERLAFPGTRRDPAAARALFEKACKAGAAAGCLELAVEGPSNARDACLARGTARDCAEAVYGVATVGRVTDAELMAKAERVLRAACDAGRGLACNDLGYLIERRLVAPRSPEGAVAFYQRACVSGSALGCASLVMAAVRKPSLARAMAWGNAVSTLAAECEESVDSKREACLALAFAKQRGFGGKVELATGKALAARLCKAGFSDACVR